MKTAIIIGAGPAGLTAAYELLQRTDIRPVVLESNPEYVGGLSKTVSYQGNRIDIGGHRFFSKSQRVMQWWLSMLPIQHTDADVHLTYQGKRSDLSSLPGGVDPATTQDVMLVRKRLSRIFFRGKFFSYPISLSMETLRHLGLRSVCAIGLTYLRRKLFPIKPEKNLEDFFLNRFGDELYQTFFRTYTEKVWGLPCKDISAEWGAQRIKGLSVTKVLAHALKRIFSRTQGRNIQQQTTETSLIERFLYPKFGPGHMWETVARKIQNRGGSIHLGERVESLDVKGDHVTRVTARKMDGSTVTYQADYVFSTMPIKELIHAMKTSVPVDVSRVADGLPYRDFMTVGLLVQKLSSDDPHMPNKRIADNWIYIHDPHVRVGRLQIFNNWSEYLVKSQDHIWLGMEYFCNEGDDLWSKTDEEILEMAKRELSQIGLADPADILDGTVLRERKAYPAYFGTYPEFPLVRSFVDSFQNLFLIGRNGMHKYNNQDHSMLTAMTTVDNIVAGRTDKSNIWAVNAEQAYHEDEKEEGA